MDVTRKLLWNQPVNGIPLARSKRSSASPFVIMGGYKGHLGDSRIILLATHHHLEGCACLGHRFVHIPHGNVLAQIGAECTTAHLAHLLDGGEKQKVVQNKPSRGVGLVVEAGTRKVCVRNPVAPIIIPLCPLGSTPHCAVVQVRLWTQNQHVAC